LKKEEGAPCRIRCSVFVLYIRNFE